ncbi:MAG: hypothetical protein PVF05_04275 [Gemmatimonadales bacterium]
MQTARGSLQARRFTAASLTIAILGPAACDSPDLSTPAAWCVADSGVAVAFTPADDPGAWARNGRGSPRFVELWRAGGLNEGEELSFPLGAAASRSGRLAIADFELSELAVVDADGSWQERWATPGEGPGELGFPVAANWVTGDTAVAVFDIGNAKVLFLDSAGPTHPDRRLPIEMTIPVFASGSLDWAGVDPTGRALIEPSPEPQSLSGDPGAVRTRSVLLRSKGDGVSFDTIASGSTPTVGGPPPYQYARAPGWPELVEALGPGGLVAVGGDTDRYRVRVLDGSGATRVVCRDAPGLPMTERETRRPDDARAEPEFEAAVAAAPRPDAPAPMGRLLISADGRLWVQRDRPSVLRYAEGYQGVPGARYDVFDADGAYLGEVRAPEGARFQAALGDTVWAFEIGELDETWVVAYEMRWD